MDHSDWDSVLQFVADPLEMDFGDKPDESIDRPTVHISGIQVPTPPQSHEGTPIVEDLKDDDSTLVSVSTTFYPGAHHHSLPSDTSLLSSDNVFFYVHARLILAASDNGFRGLLVPRPVSSKDQDSIIHVPEVSTVLNIILHSVYDMSCAHYSPTFETLATAVSRLPQYGIKTKEAIMPSTPLYSLLLSYAPLHPLDLYALAASFDLYDLAVTTSSHLLSFSLATLTDEMAERIGAVYLKRLFFLHFGRSDALKRVLLPPPLPHPPTLWCDFTEQKRLTRAWALASAYLAWDARPDLSTSTMESALRPLAEHLTCEHCQHALRDRIKNLVLQCERFDAIVVESPPQNPLGKMPVNLFQSQDLIHIHTGPCG